MKKALGISLFILMAIIIFKMPTFLFKETVQTKEMPVPRQTKEYRRIISFLPSITEILFALGAGDRVVGVTRYCWYPPEAQQITKIGGILDTGFEAVYSLNPDLLVISVDATDQISVLEKMDMPILKVETKNIEGILESIHVIGETVGRKEKAKEIASRIEGKIEMIRRKTKDLFKPRVLVTFLRPFGEGNIREVFIAGNHTFFNDLIHMAGGQNAYQGHALITSPMVSAEGILAMNPDIIIEIMSGLDRMQYTREDVLKDWQTLPQLKAYQEKKVFILDQSYAAIPGPRMTQTLDEMARIIHPEILWDER